ncbi:element excision factor XisI family protein [uncultured Nostoc sp.]|uniref:element excision factor XisI family protein n=1 Tax=uncultured Nostoc sp. TaxID=340711 RepID=UPI0035C98F41
MDKLARYRQIIRQLIFDYAIHKPANGQIETESVIDSEPDLYEVLYVGWDGVRRVHGSVVIDKKY